MPREEPNLSGLGKRSGRRRIAVWATLLFVIFLGLAVLRPILQTIDGPEESPVKMAPY